MNLLTVTIFLILFFLPACNDQAKNNTNKNVLSEKTIQAKINNILINAQVDLSSIDNELPYEIATVKLDKYLYAFSGSVEITARKKGVLLNQNKVITSIKVFIRGESRKINKTYAVLFDDEKKLIHSLLLGSNLSVATIIKEDDEDDSIIEFSALLREDRGPATEIKNFKVLLENNQLTLLE